MDRNKDNNTDKYLTLCQTIIENYNHESSEKKELAIFIKQPEIKAILDQYTGAIFRHWHTWKKQQQIKPKTISLEKKTVRPKKMMTPLQTQFRLANATIGKAYKSKLHITSDAKIFVHTISGLTALGLQYDNEYISGTPTKAGEFKLEIVFGFQNQTHHIRQRKEINFIINNDPKSLWKNISSATHLKFWKDDEAVLGKQGQQNWQLVGVSKRGRSHAHTGKCRDDDFNLLVDENSGWHVVAVADGAGSSKYSRKGADIAVKTSTTQLAKALQKIDTTSTSQPLAKNKLETIFHHVIHCTVKAIYNVAKQHQSHYKDFYTTLLLLAHKSLPDGKQLVVSYWIGDGALVLYKKNDKVILLGESDSGEYAGQTRFLDKKSTSVTEIKKRLRLVCEENITALCLMTDGITDPLFETDYNLHQLAKWDEFWQTHIETRLSNQPAKTAHQLLQWLDFWSVGNHDDRTLFLLYPQETTINE